MQFPQVPPAPILPKLSDRTSVVPAIAGCNLLNFPPEEARVNFPVERRKSQGENPINYWNGVNVRLI